VFVDSIPGYSLSGGPSLAPPLQTGRLAINRFRINPTGTPSGRIRLFIQNTNSEPVAAVAVRSVAFNPSRTSRPGSFDPSTYLVYNIPSNDSIVFTWSNLKPGASYFIRFYLLSQLPGRRCSNVYKVHAHAVL